ncbi:Glycosyltransferase involved in cell wall bisynthesis [Verrucomicrobium sp. GAS474]|uniref:glycosyltransferase n=1 Tax=Verrucomicrobium sp. GAS474 TaxID=1882831 RepID=UPI00087AC338|nr:glycosyltransferase [Verrucomicrobium sp. GAS474]SDU14214.1 Glycosyltransferase involved in cell wall bisynthesis [Verrucomicrobium sp. GAS474]
MRIMPLCRVDLHLHSRFSDRPSEWILRQLGMPQSYSQPEALYARLHQAGMRWKTITDHNRIDGALELAARHDDVFLSEEVTTYFPDGCKIHLLVWNLTEAQHREIATLRENIYDLAGWLRVQKLPHGVAHPLSDINGKLTPAHVEKLLLLFRVFEGRNGNREPLAQQVLGQIVASLTPEKLAQLADRHHLAPVDADFHRKILTGGSDDHGGLYAGRTWTEAAVDSNTADTVDGFFAALHSGLATPQGEAGTPLHLSSSFYNTVFSYAQDRMKKTAPLAANLLSTVAQRFVTGKNPTDFSFGEQMGFVVEAVRTGQVFDFFKPGETTLSREFAAFFTDPKVKTDLDTIIRTEAGPERRSFAMASYLTNQLSYRLFLEFMRRVERGSLLDAFQSLTGIVPVAGAVLPYVVAYRQQAPARPFLRETAREFLPEVPSFLRNEKRAWFTDTLEDVNGVARTICSMTAAGLRAGADLTVVTSRSEVFVTDIPVKNFAPVGEFEIPEYKLQKMSFPPFLEILDYIEREGFTELVISTPGPVGLCALAAGKLLGLRLTSIYHTDFPQYARFLSDDAFMETVTWRYMQWFYGQFHRIYANSEFYRQCWIDRGIPASRLEIFPRGLDTSLFATKFRRPDFWTARGAKPGAPVLLYVGRVSKEKELGFLVDVARELEKRGASFTVALVGDGPFRDEMAAALPGAIFTGVLTGEELAAAYASADLFLFPSTTDTFGNVVIEAMACGLPVVVSDVGGPRELITAPARGAVVPARNLKQWADTVSGFLAALPTEASRQALSSEIHEERSWDRAFQKFWNE